MIKLEEVRIPDSSPAAVSVCIVSAEKICMGGLELASTEEICSRKFMFLRIQDRSNI